MTARLVASHPFVTMFALPVLGLWYFLEHVEGPYTHAINEVEKVIMFIVWWVGLGILSSIGLGSGMHTGVLFLFPHIMKVSQCVWGLAWTKKRNGLVAKDGFLPSRAPPLCFRAIGVLGG